MPRTYSKIVLHCVYSTKNRIQSIREPERAWRITREIARNIKVDILAIGGTSDHIHLLLSLPTNRAVSDVMAK
jgi:putative transposase